MLGFEILSTIRVKNIAGLKGYMMDWIGRMYQSCRIQPSKHIWSWFTFYVQCQGHIIIIHTEESKTSWQCIIKNNASGFIAVLTYMWFLIKFGIACFHNTHFISSLQGNTFKLSKWRKMYLGKGKKLQRVVLKTERNPAFTNYIDPRVITSFLGCMYNFTVCVQTDIDQAKPHKDEHPLQKSYWP